MDTGAMHDHNRTMSVVFGSSKESDDFDLGLSARATKDPLSVDIGRIRQRSIHIFSNLLP